MGEPDLQTLRLFLSIFELRNLTHAAQRHAIAPSAVTKRIQDMERHYGIELFHRQSRGVIPTTAGEELARHVRDLFSRIAHIAGSMSEFAQGSRGQVRVHANASILLEALIAAIVSFTRLHPLIRIDLQELMSWAIVRDVAEGRADVGLVADAIVIPSDLTVAVYAHDRLMAICPANHALAARKTVAFEELLDFDQIGIGATSALSVQLAEQADQLHRIIRHAYRTATYDVARMMVAQGCGIAVLPSSLVVPYVSDKLVSVPLSDSWARRKMQLCYREEASLTVAARLFIQHLLEQAFLASTALRDRAGRMPDAIDT
jgi:DNA-binding transcriptional LysR family regulator